MGSVVACGVPVSIREEDPNQLKSLVRQPGFCSMSRGARGQLAFPDRDEIPFMDTDIARGLVMPKAQPAQRPTEAPPKSSKEQP